MTVQGPVKGQQPNGMSHGGGGGLALTTHSTGQGQAGPAGHQSPLRCSHKPLHGPRRPALGSCISWVMHPPATPVAHSDAQGPVRRSPMVFTCRWPGL